MNKKNYFNNQKGQALIIVVLVMVVSLTVALSVGLKSITNVQTSVDNENSQRAFSAAEAGIEKALKSGVSSTEFNLGTNTNASIKKVDVTNISGLNFLLNNGASIARDDGVDVWLVEHNADGTLNYGTLWNNGNLNIYWGTSATDCNNAAIEVIVISGLSADVATAKRYAFDPCTSRGNNFTTPSSGVFSMSGKSFYYSVTIPVSSGILARVVPIYYSTPLGVTGSIPLPSQGKKIDSVGKAGNTQRKISFFQGYPKLPGEFFQYILFSGQ